MIIPKFMINLFHFIKTKYLKKALTQLRKSLTNQYQNSKTQNQVQIK